MKYVPRGEIHLASCASTLVSRVIKDVYLHHIYCPAFEPTATLFQRRSQSSLSVLDLIAGKQGGAPWVVAADQWIYECSGFENAAKAYGNVLLEFAERYPV
jgi:hypothetical protein